MTLHHTSLPQISMKGGTMATTASRISADVDPAFHLFNQLPTELRNMIWERALPGPRVVYLECCFFERPHCYRVRSDRATDEIGQWGLPSFFDCDEISEDEFDRLVEEDAIGPIPQYHSDNRGFRTRSPPPALLTVCRESFQVATKHYERAFGSVNTFPEAWFDFEIDTLYLNWGWKNGIDFDPEDLAEDDLARVRYLAIDTVSDWSLGINEYEGEEDLLAFMLCWCPNIERISLCSQEAFHTVEEAADVVLRDPVPLGVSVMGTIEDYQLDPAEISSKEDATYRKARQVYEMTGPPIDMERLNEFVAKNVEKGLKPRPLPEIVAKIFTTPAIHNKLLVAEAEWEKEKNCEAEIGSFDLDYQHLESLAQSSL